MANCGVTRSPVERLQLLQRADRGRIVRQPRATARTALLPEGKHALAAITRQPLSDSPEPLRPCRRMQRVRLRNDDPRPVSPRPLLGQAAKLVHVMPQTRHVY